MKDFDKWNERKIKLNSNKKYRHPKEKEIWWCSVGVNIGTEIYGKGEHYTKPVLVIDVGNGESFIGIPLTSKIKSGRHFCIVKSGEKIGTALIYQIRNFDKRRLAKKIGRMSEDDYKKVIDCLLKIFKIL